MIAADQLELLTAAVDGELTPRQARRVRRLLAESADARAVFARLRDDSERLRNLPRATPPADLIERVMACLPADSPVITPAPPGRIPSARPVGRPHRPSWLPLAVAASVLVGVSAGSFLFFVRQNEPAPGFAGKYSKGGTNQPKYAEILPPENGRLPSAPAPTESGDNRVVRNDSTNPPVGPGAPDEIPAPRLIDRDALGGKPVVLPPLELIQVRIPLLVSATDLDREDARQQLIEELGRDGAYRIDLFVKDAARAAEVFQRVGPANGLTLYTDAAGLDRVKKKQATAVVLFTDSLSPAEVRDLLVKAAADDANTLPRAFEMLHVTALQPPEHRDHQKDFTKDLRDLLGVDPGLWKKPVVPAGAATEPKPISAGTGDMVVKTLTAKPGEKPAVLLAYGPPQARTVPAMSAELKQYLARRGDRKPNTVPVAIVIRPTSG